jgi:hypothetical protein
VKIYIDGVLVKSGAKTLNTNGTNLLLGAALDNSGYWNGSLDEIRVYDRALSAAEALSLYNTEKP